MSAGEEDTVRGALAKLSTALTEATAKIEADAAARGDDAKGQRNPTSESQFTRITTNLRKAAAKLFLLFNETEPPIKEAGPLINEIIVAVKVLGAVAEAIIDNAGPTLCAEVVAGVGQVFQSFAAAVADIDDALATQTSGTIRPLSTAHVGVVLGAVDDLGAISTSSLAAVAKGLGFTLSGLADARDEIADVADGGGGGDDFMFFGDDDGGDIDFDTGGGGGGSGGGGGEGGEEEEVSAGDEAALAALGAYIDGVAASVATAKAGVESASPPFSSELLGWVETLGAAAGRLRSLVDDCAVNCDLPLDMLELRAAVDRLVDGVSGFEEQLAMGEADSLLGEHALTKPPSSEALLAACVPPPDA